jgi:Spy/CpxP family protein refolding chaperone
MKTRTWILITALACAPFFAAGSALAQDVGPRMHRHEEHGHGRRHGGPGQRIEMLVAILGLDAHQEASVRQIFEANRPRREQIRTIADPAARQAAMRALREETHSAIDALLTPDQRATLDRMHAVRQEHGPRGRGHGGRGPSAPPTGI